MRAKLIPSIREVIKVVQSGGNGHSQDPDIKKTYEHLDEDTQTTQDRWVEEDGETGDRRIVFGEEVREDLGIEDEDEES